MDSAPGACPEGPSSGPRASDVSRSGTWSAPAREGAEARHDYVLVGGGLQNALITLALLERRPDVRLALIEREARIGGDHTWCFHETDVPAAAAPWLERLVVRSWSAHDVAFPGYRRQLSGGYAAITSERLQRVVDAALARAPHARRVMGHAREVGADHVALDDGQRLSAELVIDARGPEHARVATGGYQKFLGLELAVAGAVPAQPMLMDASVEQLDGFRFVYVLPWADDRLLIEDTYYSDRPDLDAAALRERVFAYARRLGLQVREVLREERGVLPIPTRLGAEPASEAPLRAGYAGGLFHPTTGYSLPVAVRLALHLAAHAPGAALGAEYARWLRAHRRQVRYCLLLNRLLFTAFAPEQRYHVLERFYRLPSETIRRFYALDTSAADRARILCGRPPRGFSLGRWLARRPSA
ncbi:MAG TPA: lycopene beta-cyclase CrtY [Polyangiaceae bacterium]|nr:lycopene beta-cyclase CrtY [Polyangiaceae bacterium]